MCACGHAVCLVICCLVMLHSKKTFHTLVMEEKMKEEQRKTIVLELRKENRKRINIQNLKGMHLK